MAQLLRVLSFIIVSARSTGKERFFLSPAIEILLNILAISDCFRFSSSERKKENHTCTNEAMGSKANGE